MAMSYRERLKFWLCCKPQQHSRRFSWDRDSPQLTNDAPGTLATATFAHPQRVAPGSFPTASGQHCSPQRYQAPFPNHCPPGRPGACPKGIAVLAMPCPTVMRTSRDQLPESPAAPWTLSPPERKPKVHFFNPVAAFVMLSGLRRSHLKDRPRIHSGRLTQLHSTPSCLVALIKSTWKNNPRGCADK